ncbi:LysR family transcriptional regulator [Peribacillus asahii]|uniref:LysR family transcriptional regulator n=1 Tax=Peribacillus asahii TaxID=228899 RepID=A0A398B313_9BACI|nr:LysR family transcriptional regulator [Peribacillus asahii]RID84339.1 LysR family transcriptional regulator [Peribacillus asahii]
MNFEQLDYIKAIVENKSMSIASQQLHVTQSAISQSIAMLEKELGVQLFKRSRNGTSPTEDGLWIIPKLMEILQKSNELKMDIQSKTETFSGKVTIATIPSIFMTLLPEALASFKKDFPLVHYAISELENNQVLKAIEQKKADVGFITLTHESKSLDNQLIYHPLNQQSHFHLLVSAKSILAIRSEIQLQDVLDESFILFGEHFYSSLTKGFEEKYKQLSIIFQSSNPEVIKKSVAAGLGVSVVSKTMIEDDPYIESGRIKAIPLIGYPFNFSLSFGAIYDRNCSNYKLVQRMLTYFNK